MNCDMIDELFYRLWMFEICMFFLFFERQHCCVVLLAPLPHSDEVLGSELGGITVASWCSSSSARLSEASCIPEFISGQRT